MAIQLQSTNGRLYKDLTGDTFDHDQNWTLCWWARRDVDSGTYEGNWAFSKGAARTISVEMIVNNDDTWKTQFNAGGGAASSLTATVGTWIFFAYCRNTTATSSKLWYRLAGDSSLTDGSSWSVDVNPPYARAPNNAFDLLQFGFLADGSSLHGNHSIAHVRLWPSTFLSEAQCLTESQNATHQYTSTTPFLAWELGEDGTDSSGNARTASTSGTVAYVEGPLASGTSVAPLVMGSFMRMRNS